MACISEINGSRSGSGTLVIDSREFLRAPALEPTTASGPTAFTRPVVVKPTNGTEEDQSGLAVLVGVRAVTVLAAVFPGGVPAGLPANPW
jgi:hypothetical protein